MHTYTDSVIYIDDKSKGSFRSLVPVAAKMALAKVGAKAK
jgi:hypothetical protein